MLTWVRSHCTREIMSLCGQQKVPVALLRSQGRRATRVERQQRPHLKTTDGAAVVLESHHTVVLGTCLSSAREQWQSRNVAKLGAAC
jgi:hypothetical protein